MYMYLNMVFTYYMLLYTLIVLNLLMSLSGEILYSVLSGLLSFYCSLDYLTTQY